MNEGSQCDSDIHAVGNFGEGISQPFDYMHVQHYIAETMPLYYYICQGKMDLSYRLLFPHFPLYTEHMKQ